MRFTRIPSPWLRFALVSAAAIVLFAAMPFAPFLNAISAALVCLLGVVLLSVYWSWRDAALFAVLSTIGINYFYLPPVHTFHIADSTNWTALLVYLAVAFLAGRLASRARSTAEQAAISREQAERLYSLSHDIMTVEDPLSLQQEIPLILLRVLQLDGVALYIADGEQTFTAGTVPADLSLAELQKAVAVSPPASSAAATSLLLPVHLGVRPLGSLFLSGQLPAATTIEAVSGLVGVGLERARALARSGRVEALRESERLRTIILDSITHDLRTPLTSVRAAVTALQSEPTPPPEETAELVAIIDEESDRLNRLIGQAVEMARWNEGSVELRRESQPLEPLAVAAVEEHDAELAGHIVAVAIPKNLPPIFADAISIRKVLGHLLQNAGKYSPTGSRISISAEDSATNPDFVTIRVENEGPGIASDERDLIFDKFYRGRDQRQLAPGTGLGLAIVSAIIAAHGGRVWLEDPAQGGASFAFTLPVATL
jgi:two-component system sensor histidine kinase KdpD